MPGSNRGARDKIAFGGPPVSDGNRRDTDTGPPPRGRGRPIALTAPDRAVNLTSLGGSNSMNTTWIMESPLAMVEGESITYTVTYLGAASVSSPTTKAYKDGTDVTTTVFPTNAPSASGNVVTLSPVTGLVGGQTYIVALTATVDARTEIRKLKILAVSDEGE